MDVTQSAVLESEDNDPFSSAEPTTQMFSSNLVDFTADNSNSAKQETTAEYAERQLSVSSSSSDLIGTISGLVIRDVTFPPLRINDNWRVVYVTSVTSPSSFYVSASMFEMCFGISSVLHVIVDGKYISLTDKENLQLLFAEKVCVEFSN